MVVDAAAEVGTVAGTEAVAEREEVTEAVAEKEVGEEAEAEWEAAEAMEARALLPQSHAGGNQNWHRLVPRGHYRV